MKHNGGVAAAVRLLCVVGASACLLPRPAGAAGSTWQPNPAPALRGHYGSAAHHHGLSPLSAPAPTPTAGADLPSLPPVYSRAPEQQTSPHFGFPLQPTVGVTAPPAGAPSACEGYPFIGSNPTVPLPTGVTDTATVLPVPDTGDGDGKVVGRAALVRAQIAMICLLVVFSMVSSSWS